MLTLTNKERMMLEALKKLRHILDNYDGEGMGKLSSIADEAIVEAETEESLEQDRSATPAILDEAIRNALCVGPLSEVQSRLYSHIRDFMAQKFGVFYLHAEGFELKRLEELFKILVRRDK